MHVKEKRKGNDVGTAFEHKRKGKCQDPDQEERGEGENVSKKEEIRKSERQAGKQTDTESGKTRITQGVHGKRSRSAEGK